MARIYVGINGIFGSETYNALRAFQNRSGLYPDDIAVSNTLEAFDYHAKGRTALIYESNGYITIRDDTEFVYSVNEIF